MNVELKRLRLNSSKTMKELSNELDISESYYCLIENGERKPSVEIAKKIANALGFDWTLFYESGQKRTERTHKKSERQGEK